jgi:hypothetical protein
MRAVPFNPIALQVCVIRLWATLASLLVLGFEIQAATYSGRVTDGGAGVGGVTIRYSWIGADGSVTTSGNGNWSSSGWVLGTAVTFTPSQSGYTFTPSSRSYTTGFSDQGGVNFSRISHTISGNISKGGVGLGGVTVSLTGAMSATTTTAANGNFSFARLRTGSYTITPSRPGTVFTPTNRTTTLAPSRTGMDFSVLVPVVTTLPAADVGFGEALFRGNVEGEGTIETSAWFEYGAGEAFDTTTPVQLLPPSVNEVTVTADVTGLSGGVNYNYRLVAANAHGTHSGFSQEFLMPFPAAGNAVSLSGASSSFVNVGTDPVLRVTNALTLEAWINATGQGGGDSGGAIINREGEYLLSRFPDGTIRYAIANNEPGWQFVDTGVVIPENQWTHVALTYDPTAAEIRLYIHGVLAYSAEGTGPIGDALPAQNELRIGSRQGATSQVFEGQIDDVRIWNVARTETEIQSNFQRRLTGSEPGLLAYFKFDESSGTSTADSGPHNLSGTLMGSASFIPSGAHIRDPIATTLEPTPVLATRATFRASVNPIDSGTVAYFEYGETSAYGRATSGEDIGSGLKPLGVSASVTDLQPGTTYHYRSVAFNEFGTTYGEDQAFTTLVLGVGWPTPAKVTGGWSDSPQHVVGPQGNAYVAGRFTGSATFRNTLVAENGTPDGFVGKLGRGADWLWENQVVAHTNSAVAIHGIAVDSARNVYLAGAFSGTVTLGAHQLTTTGETDLFVAKLNSAGDTWLWARSAGMADQSVSANALAVTPDGDVFITGHFGGSLSVGETNLESVGSQDVLVARLDTEGNWLWAQRAGGTEDDTAQAIALNSVGDAYVTGSFQGSSTFGGTTLHAAGEADLFIARIGANGQWLLARRAGGMGVGEGTGLAIDAAGDVYLLGRFAGTADYSDTVQNLNPGPDTRLFVAKLNPNANLLWYAQAGAGDADAITVDAAGRVYITGEFNVSTSFGSPVEMSLVSSGNSDVFVARLDARSGAWTWAKKIGSSGAERRGSIGVDGQGGIVVSGTFQGTVPMGHALLTTANERDVFVARLDAEAVFEHNTYIVGQPIPVPIEAQDPDRDDGGAIAQPTITILEREHADSDNLNSFVWSLSEKKLYPVRPVTATLRWPLTTDVTNTTSVATVVGRSVWPSDPQIHVANTPVELEPDAAGFTHRFLNLAFTTVSGATVEAGNRKFHAPQPGWTVLQFLDTGGELADPTLHPSRFEVVRTVLWNNPAHLLDNRPATIGTALTHPAHNDPTGKNGFVYFERAFYDGAGQNRAHDRSARTGPILPVNRVTSSADDDLVVVWYRTNPVIGIAWPSMPVRYIAQWPTDPEELVLASGIGSGMLDPADYPDKQVYHQPDRNLPGFNPNEEHAALYGDVLHALRNDLNAVIGASDPYTLLKYRDPVTDQWTMKVFRVVATNTAFRFVYSGQAGQPLQPPAPLNILPLCGTANTWISGPGFQDHRGRLYARAAGPDNSGANIVTRYWYPLQPGFYYDLNGDGEPNAAIGDCIPWLDHRPGGTLDVPVDVTYNITWPEDVPTLQIGETLLGAKFGLPNLRNFAHAQVIFDEGDPVGADGGASLTRLFDPLATRTLQLRPEDANDFVQDHGYGLFRVDDAAALFAGLATANDAGLTVFTDLPFPLRSRLRYDSLNQNLIFRGLLDESQDYGGPDNPLLLLNVLSPRERDRLKQLNGDPVFSDLINALYDLTRNPNHVDLDGDGVPDRDLLVGLIQNEDREVIPEELGDGPKVLSAGRAQASGYVTLVENNHPSLGGLPVSLHIIRVDEGPHRGDIKVVQSDNVFDEKLSLRLSGDFGGEPQNFEFQWFYRPVEAGTDPSAFPTLLPNGDIDDLRGWTQYFDSASEPAGLNDITLGDGGESSLLVLGDNYFVCRYRGYVIDGETPWSDWIGIIGGGQAQLAEGWVKRVRDGLNPFEARSRDFHVDETVTFASMLQQAGPRYEGDIAFNPDGGNINQIGLIEAYETVLRRAKHLSIDGAPPINHQPANDALLLAAGYIADLYFLLGNEAVADAADPTIGFRADSFTYGTLAPSIFAFQNQLDSLLEEELVLLRGRDDRSASVRVPPVYNRLFWNFTRDEGEVAYVQVYNITDQNEDGFIDATDARVMFPQGHGDAWGHYLTAIKTYYDLLQNPHFDWIPRSEQILLSGVPVEVNYMDERKFARAAAAKAKTGAEIVDLTYRLNYVDDPAGQYQGYKDTDPERAWGVSEWAHRAGSGALFDWVLANAVLPATDPNPDNTGITKIDRTTVPELNEIIAGYDSVQSQMDKADAGLNPLGLAKNVVPFDIDPSLIASGKTHFEQIYERALESMNNAVTVFNHANQLSQALRGLQDTVTDFSRNVDQQERDYKNRLIEIFGYPYAGDIGPGRTYPSGYDGPDMYHYMYVNATELSGESMKSLKTNVVGHFTPLAPSGAVARLADFFFPNDVPDSSSVELVTNGVLLVDYPVTDASYGMVAPREWGQRRAPGQLQLALSDLLQSQARMKQGLANYNALIHQIDDAAELLEARFALQAEIISIRNRADSTVTSLRAKAAGFGIIAGVLKAANEKIDSLTDITTESLPKVLGTSSDVTAPVRGGVKAAAFIGKTALKIGQAGAEAAVESNQTAQEDTRRKEAIEIESAQYDYEIQQKLKELEQLIRQEPALRLEVFALREALSQHVGHYQASLARGLRLLEERVAFRKNAAADTQQSRYQDMTFRIFRNDAIQKYRAQFDLAAQYVFLAAVAYDYETQLLGGHTGAGSAFLTDIVRQRALGEVIDGVPIAGRHGLADPLARLNQNFGVLKGQLGFNNPQTETGRFSLRSELFRIGDASREAWRSELKKAIVPNLWDIPEFRRYCRPFAPESAGPQPGLVIRFPTTVTFGLNYFGWPLGGGDSAYDPTLFATKVRSAGVWFSDYNGSGLSVTPRVYLVPAGADVMRSPSGNDLETREWRVVDQKIPVPFPIGFSSLNNPAWMPMNDSLSDTFADIRRFSSFRAYHDSGFFDPSQTISDSRLIGRSVWNTDWMLIIPGGTFLFDPNQGLDTFINSVSDIKLFFQTYAYSGN